MIIDKIQKFNLKNKIIVNLVGFTLILFSLIYSVVIPSARDIRAMSKDIEEQRIDLEEKYLKGQSLRQLRENLKQIQPKLDLFDKIFINKNRELEFITTLENEANKAQVSQRINLSAPRAAENQEFQKNNLQLYAQGGFIRQLTYLLNLESLSYYVNVKLLELTLGESVGAAKINFKPPQTSPNQTNNINLSIDADTYWK
ncbi:hypothetical protein A3H66_01245 [Candidatus Falkowbacteria bacterium RIFCSPLOWO2_02_FULL_45_21]|uniref:Uncharacterized protein n=1 Tax=Candidatus Falkowbacteria bacterium RIFCSPLOWO2_02_FULL_45_21 TaxID=1797989 RepID=A0A1F5SBB1_9BACT|nr:MAG: hypothetical protein A3H66_01245 [Candidatus Falkowbacteria bacterium RIFCSPLOWO2_02_FULL_45_21]